MASNDDIFSHTMVQSTMETPTQPPVRPYTRAAPRKGPTNPRYVRDPEGYQKLLEAKRQRYAADAAHREEKRAKTRETSRRYYHNLKAELAAARARLEAFEKGSTQMAPAGPGSAEAAR